MSYDIIIKGGTILDGTGNAGKEADIGLKDDEITAVGKLGDAKAETVIDATGKYVTPGFIDITNHSDTHLTLFKYPQLESLVMQGITTVIGGNCGGSLAPLASHEAIDTLKKWADISYFNTDWVTVEEFLNAVDTLRPGVNFGTFIGYGTLRRGIIKNEVRELKPDEKEEIKKLVRDGIEYGGFGLSLGLSYGHERVATTESIIETCKILKEGGGIVKMHLRSEGKGILASVNEAIRITREAGVPVQISHLKAIGKKAWPLLPKALDLIERARKSGADVMFDVSPYATTGSPLYLLIPAWARQGGFKELFKRIDNPKGRNLIIKDLESLTLHYDKILITSADVKTIVGQTIAEVAEEAKLPPEETLLNAVRANEGRVSIVGRTVSVKNTQLEIQNPNSLIASDGVGSTQEEATSGNLVHPRSFGAFPRFWRQYVTERGMAPHEAIRKITAGPAERVGLKKRGIIKKGNFADILVFDSRLLQDRARYRDPFKYAAGIEWVIINGQAAVEQGKYMGVRAGRALRKQ
jgi:N-acyl-D-amino-acid deacylase